MFTGIILQNGVIDAVDKHESGARLRLRTNADEPFARGESVAVNGVCLTILPEDGGLVADLSEETLSRTTLGSLRAGALVNIERALALGDRLGGHLVQGHVDTVGALLSIVNEGEFAVHRWSYPSEYADLVISKGSIAVDGVSLTIVDPGQGSFGAALIPETLRRTTLGTARIGDGVNLEFDMIGKYLRNLAAPWLATKAPI
ncbi:MAG: riboflavin synthase [Thermoanaerobaculia bacterium]